MSRVWSSRCRLLGIAAACFFLATTAHAACTSPTAAEGSLDYNVSSHYFQYCDNTSTWQPLVSGGGGGFADHIISGTTNIYVNSTTSFISFTTNGSVANYFDSVDDKVKALQAANDNLRIQLKAANDNEARLEKRIEWLEEMVSAVRVARSRRKG